MKKNRWLPYLALGVALALFHVVAFAVPAAKNVVFWITYAFTLVAFLFQPLLWRSALGKKDTLKSKFLWIPVIHVGLSYLVIQLLTFVVFLIFSDIPSWIAVIACSLIAALCAACAIAGQAGAAEIDRVEKKIADKRFYLQSLQADIELLAQKESDPAVRSALKKLAEQVRFSDPMGHEQLRELESQILCKVEEMKTGADKRALIPQTEALLTERNQKCKILK